MFNAREVNLMVAGLQILESQCYSDELHPDIKEELEPEGEEVTN